ncbi:MAG: hypothetical protein AB7F59_06715 [Bdellovibrionales bacterium]
MKTKSYRYGKFAFKAYHRNVGQGFEVGLYFNRKPIFVGNFIHKKEALRWWGQMNREIKSFTKKYWVTSNTNFEWYKKFFGNHLYKSYYSYLDKLFNKYNTTFHKAFSRDVKKYNRMKKSFHKDSKTTVRAA